MNSVDEMKDIKDVVCLGMALEQMATTVKTEAGSAVSLYKSTIFKVNWVSLEGGRTHLQTFLKKWEARSEGDELETTILTLLYK